MWLFVVGFRTRRAALMEAARGLTHDTQRGGFDAHGLRRARGAPRTRGGMGHVGSAPKARAARERVALAIRLYSCLSSGPCDGPRPHGVSRGPGYVQVWKEKSRCLCYSCRTENSWKKSSYGSLKSGLTGAIPLPEQKHVDVIRSTWHQRYKPSKLELVRRAVA